jgi:hypothetical protein
LERAFLDEQEAFLRCVPTTPEGVEAKIDAFLTTPSSNGVTHEGLKKFLGTLHETTRLMPA